MEPLFSVGEKITCIDSSPQFFNGQRVESKLIEGKEYTVTDIVRCKCKKNLGITVGVREDVFTGTVCRICGVEMPTRLERTYNQHRFIKASDIKSLEEQINYSLNLSLLKPVNEYLEIGIQLHKAIYTGIPPVNDVSSALYRKLLK